MAASFAEYTGQACIGDVLRMACLDFFVKTLEIGTFSSLKRTDKCIIGFNCY